MGFYVRKSTDNVYFVERDGDKCSLFETDNAIKAYKLLYKLQSGLEKTCIRMRSLQKYGIALPCNGNR